MIFEDLVLESSKLEDMSEMNQVNGVHGVNGLNGQCEVDDFAGEFEVNILLKHLKLCMEEGEETVKMDEYIEVFKQLYKFFCMLGTVFGFVGSDVKSKVIILQQHRTGDSREKYETVESMLEYEVSEGLTKSNKETNGSRTLLRLHRSLIFVSQFLDKSLQIKDEEGTTHICKSAYDNTLAKYHPWLIKKGAHMAMYALPTRYDLFTKVCGHEVERSHVDASVKEVIERTQAIYDRCEQLYKDRDLLSLP